MSPIRSYSGWSSRASNSEKQKEPYRHYYFLCEGQNTERWYFEKFVDMRKELGISSLISVECLEKTGRHSGWSSPKSLCELADSYRRSLRSSFDPKRDAIVVVFDTDVFESRNKAAYEQLIERAAKNNVVCVTNPSFELFLLLHFENSYNELIRPNSAKILANNWVDYNGARVRYIEYLFRKKSGLRPKKDPKIAELVRNVSVAIGQEEFLNNDVRSCRGKLTSNVGTVIREILEEKGSEEE